MSDAVRRLVDEALAARDATTSGRTITLTEDGMRWIDREAKREGIDRDTMVRVLLREASTARDTKRALKRP